MVFKSSYIYYSDYNILSVSRCPYLTPHPDQLFCILIPMRCYYVSIAMGSCIDSLLEVKLLRVQWWNARLECHQSQVNIVKAAILRRNKQLISLPTAIEFNF